MAALEDGAAPPQKGAIENSKFFDILDLMVEFYRASRLAEIVPCAFDR
jgi:hypothetical protein